MYTEIDLNCKHCGNKLKARQTGSRPLLGIKFFHVPVLEFVHAESRKGPCPPLQRRAAPPSLWAAISAYHSATK